MKSLLFLILLSFLAGCRIVEGYNRNEHFIVNANSVGSTDFGNDLYYLFPADSSMLDDPLVYSQFKRMIEWSLKTKGMKLTNDLLEANKVLMFKYGISNPEEIESVVVVPSFGTTGANIITSTSTSSVNQSNTSVNLQRGVTGYNEHTIKRIVYIRYLTFQSHELSTGEYQIDWRTAITSTGSSSDLRKILPVMLAGAKEYIGKDSGNERAFRVQGNDRRIAEVLEYE